MTEFLSFID